MVCGLRGFPNVQGGVETHASNLYPLLVKRGCKVTVVARNRFHERDLKEWKGIEFKRLWCPKSTALEAVIHTFLAVLYAAFKRPDILHIHAVGPAIMVPLARMAGLKVVMTHHGPDYDREKWGKVAKLVLRLGERYGSRASNETIAISGVIKDLLRLKHGVNAALIPNGVTIPNLAQDWQTLDRYAVKRHSYILLVSRIVPEKRHMDLIEAFRIANIPGWKLVLVGEDDHHGSYEQEVLAAAEIDPDIVCTGMLRGRELYQLYCHAGVFVLPSSHEGLPIALLEALSFGLTSLASDIPSNKCVGLPEQQYFKLGDTEQLSKKLEEACAKENSQQEREAIRCWVAQHYDWPSIADSTYELFCSLFREKKRQF